MRIRAHLNTHRPRFRFGLTCLVVAMCVGCGNAETDSGSTTTRATQPKPSPNSENADAVTLALVSIEDYQSAIALQGLAAHEIESVAPDAWSRHFKVYIGAEVEPDQPAMLGSYALKQGQIVFTPEFGLESGMSYTAVFSGIDHPQTIRRTFELPPYKAPVETVVTQVFPSGQHLPQNLLKFYLHFSAPMRAGDSYSHIHLLDEDGTPIEDPFLELAQELWDDSGTRLTLFFDPGRIKKGLKPRDDVGPPLLPGRQYTLLIDADWTDALGSPLASEFRKSFDVGDPDETQPSVERWQITAPMVNTAAALEIRFDESLDRALLDRIFVVAADNGEIVGHVEISDAETVWRFFPEHPWPAGKFAVIVENTLEDVAGNSLGRPFEVDISTTQPLPTGEKTLYLSFEIAETGEN